MRGSWLLTLVVIAILYIAIMAAYVMINQAAAFILGFSLLFLIIVIIVWPIEK